MRTHVKRYCCAQGVAILHTEIPCMILDGRFVFCFFLFWGFSFAKVLDPKKDWCVCSDKTLYACPCTSKMLIFMRGGLLQSSTKCVEAATKLNFIACPDSFDPKQRGSKGG